MDLVREYYTEMFGDLKKQKDRIGGTFAVAHVIMFKEVKQILRYQKAKLGRNII